MSPTPDQLRLPLPLRGAVAATRALSRSRLLARPYGVAADRTGGAVVRAVGPGVRAWATLSDGALVQVPLDDPGYRRLWLSGEDETDIAGFARSVLRPGDVAVDVGANVGVHSLRFAALVGDVGRVHAFEPNADLAASILQSVRRNGWSGRVLVHRTALGDHAGTGALHVDDATDVRGSTTQPEWRADADRQPIVISRLDDVRALPGAPIRLLKIAVEGAALAVLQGGAALVAERPPEHLVVEVSSSFDARPLVDWIGEHGYVPVMARSGHVVPTRSPVSCLPPAPGDGPRPPDVTYLNLMFRHRSASAG